MVPADSRRIPRVPRYSGYHYAQSRFAYRALTVCGGPFQGPSARDHDTRSWSYYPVAALRQRRFGLFPRSLATTRGITVVFSSWGVLRCFSSPVSLPAWQGYRRSGGLSHSKSAVKGYLRLTALIAAYHVLHRLREPRHPPCALSYFLLLATQTLKSLREGSSYFQLVSSCGAIAGPQGLELCWFTTVSLVSICQRSFPL